MHISKVRKLAFSFFELAIVLVIIGIMAAIAIPRVLAGSEQAKLAALQASLAAVRDQIDLYVVEHKGRGPNLNKNGNPTASGVQFVRRLMETTEADGELDANGLYGPYLAKFPRNPFNRKTDVRIDGEPAGQGTEGWHFDQESGVFSADDSPDHASL